MSELPDPIRNFSDYLCGQSEAVQVPFQVYQAALAPLLELARRQQAAVQAIQTALAPFREIARRQQEAVDQLTARLASLTQPLIEHLKKAGEAEPRVLPYLADRGWFITYSFPVGIPIQLDTLIQAGKDDETDEVMCALTRERLGPVEAELCERFPDRAHILRDALEAHRAGKYTLSIPVLLAQADSIGCDVLGIRRQFLTSKDKPKALQAKLSAIQLDGQPVPLGGVRQKIMDQLRKLSLAVATEERDDLRRSGQLFSPLNRNGVLHGHDLDYHTEANSLRCISLLECLLDVDRILREELPEEVAILVEANKKA
jgi:hypothetical protein